PVALNVGGELFGGSLLTVPGERPEHPPMPALKIAPPGPAAPGLQQLFLRPAELAQIRITRDNYPGRDGPVLARTRRNNFSDQSPIGFRVRLRLCRIKPRILKELLCRAGDDEAMVRVIRFQLATLMDSFAMCI